MTESGPQADVLIFIEDPGAANCVAGLPEALQRRGHSVRLTATAHGAGHLRRLGAKFDPSGGDAGALLDETGPALVLVGTSENPDTIGLELVALARARGIVSAGILDGPSNAEHRFRGRTSSPLAFAPDWMAVPEEATEGRYLALGYPPQRIFVGGHPHFDRVRAVGRELEARGRGAVRREVLADDPGERPVVVFLAEISDSLDPAPLRRGPEYTLHGRGGSDRRTDIVLEEVLDALAEIAPRPYLVLRLHPKNGDREFSAYGAEIDQLSRSEPPLEVVYGADLVVGMTSILLFEAAILERPVLSVIPRKYEAGWLDSIGIGLTPFVATRRELREILPAALADPQHLMGKPVDDLISFGAMDRMADFIAGLLAGRPPPDR